MANENDKPRSGKNDLTDEEKKQLEGMSPMERTKKRAKWGKYDFWIYKQDIMDPEDF